MALHLIICFALIFAAGCASKPGEFRWEDDAQRMGMPKEEVELIVDSAAKAHNLVVVAISKDESDVISVYLAESRTAGGGLVVFFRKTESSWAEDPNLLSSWDRK